MKLTFDRDLAEFVFGWGDYSTAHPAPCVECWQRDYHNKVPLSEVERQRKEGTYKCGHFMEKDFILRPLPDPRTKWQKFLDRILFRKPKRYLFRLPK